MKQNKAAKRFLHKKNSFAVIISTSILAMSLTAGTCGTFAWFTYATRARVEYEGVSAGSGSLEIGFAPSSPLENYANYDLTKEVIDDGREIYWSNTKEISASTLKYFLSYYGYASEKMNPVSSGSYHKGDSNFSLYHAPMYVGETQPSTASKKSYVYLPFVFRFEDELEKGKYLPDMDIYLVKANFLSETSIHNSIRIFSSNSEANYLINPTKLSDGKTNVGGVLDLDGDGYFDTYEENNSIYEHMYGEFKTEKVHNDLPEEHDSDVPEGERTTFVARHKRGTYAIDQEKSIPETADYEGFSAFKNGFCPIAETKSSSSNYAFVDLTIYIEGWDLSVIQAEVDNPFTMELKFEVKI